MNGLRRWSSCGGALLLAAFIALFFSNNVAQARIYTELSEGFEWCPGADPTRPETVEDGWPWFTNQAEGQRWLLGTNTQNPHPRHWWVETNSIYRPGAPGLVHSLWCCGEPSDINPFQGPYPNGLVNCAVWGPVDLSDAVSSVVGFWYFCAFDYGIPANDKLWVGVMSGDQASGNMGDYTNILEYNRIDTDNTWYLASQDLSEIPVGEGDETVSFMGEESVFVGFFFISDNMSHPANLALGAYIDDVVVTRDDGLFDFEEISITPVESEEMEPVTGIYDGVPIFFRESIVAHGHEDSEVVKHILFINDVPVDTVEQSWTPSAAGEQYEILFDYLYTPEGIGNELTVRVSLDHDAQQEESLEDNNITETTFVIEEPNTQPTFRFISPDENGVTIPANVDSLVIIYEAENRPLSERVPIVFYYDEDNEGYNGTRIRVDKFVENRRDTLVWHFDRDELNQDSYYILAYLDDRIAGPTAVYSQGQVTIQGVDAREDIPVEMVSDYEIVSTYPNPFNPTVEITYNIPKNSIVNAKWYSIDGRMVDQVHLGMISAGQQRFSWTPSNLPSGTYFLRLESDLGVKTSKVVFLK